MRLLYSAIVHQLGTPLLEIENLPKVHHLIEEIPVLTERFTQDHEG
jgi:hypothetical protein